MKTHPFKPLLILAVCTATALPLAAAPRNDSSNGTKTTATKSSSDRRIDFGKPVRFVKNTFTRDDNRQDNPSMNRSQRQKDEDKSSFWNRDKKDDGRAMKKDEKPGFFDRMLGWRPFNRDKDR